MINIDKLEIKTPNYPVNIISSSKNVFLGCCAHFLGRYDVQYYKDKIEYATLVDLNKDKMIEIKSLYGDQAKWNYIVDDIYKICEQFREEKRLFDIVNIDPWTNQMEAMWETDNFKKLYNICRNFLVLNSSALFNDKHKIKNSNDYESFIKKQHNINIKCIDILKRSVHVGGIYWVILSKD